MPRLPAFLAGHAPSMSAGTHEMREYFSNRGPPRSSSHTAPSITPYLGLRARLSQVWINRWTILLMLVLARTLIAVRDLNGDLSSARREALSACTSVEDLGSTMASMPHYLSPGINELTASGIERSVNGLYQMATMSVTGVEEIVVFVINLLTSTYLCLITLAVSGSLHAVLGVLEDANKQLQSIVSGIGDDISKVVGGVEDSLNTLKNTLNGLTFGTGTVTIPTIDLSGDIDKVRQLQLPSGLDDEFQKLNNSIPNFEQVQNFTDNAIRIPFEALKNAINSSLGVYTFDRSVLPVPQKEQLSFCSGDNGINNFFDGLVKLMYDAKKVFIATLIVAAILVCIPMAWREIRRWRTMQDRSRLVGSAAHDPMDVVYIVSRPYTSGFGINISSKLKSVRRQSLVRWVIAYATTEAALFVLVLGIAGLFTCLCHYILLKEIEKQVPQLTNEVASFADKVVAKLNNASETWATSTNNAILQKQNGINEDMFGWVNTSVDAINDTLNTFTRETTKLLNITFGGTPLYDPITEVFNCLIGLKIAGIEKVLTWVEDNAHVTFPKLPNDTFSLGAVASISGDSSTQSFLAAPGDETADKISSAVLRVTTKLQDDIQTEAIISTCVLAVWFTILLIGITRALILWFGRDKTRGEGGAPNLNAHSPTFGGHASISAPTDFRSENQDRFKIGGGNNHFTDVPLHSQPDQRQVPVEPAPHYSREDPFGDDKTPHAPIGLARSTQDYPGRDLTRQSYYGDEKI